MPASVLSFYRGLAIVVAFLVSSLVSPLCLAASAVRGHQFIGFTNFTAFQQSSNATACVVLTSSEIAPEMDWDQLIISWNAGLPKAAELKVEAQAIFAGSKSKYYTLGLWSGNPGVQPRNSVLGQKDEDGDVATDTLVLARPGARTQVRLTLCGASPDSLKFLGLCFTDTRAKPEALSANRAAWGKTIPVPELSQMTYPHGDVLCSPATVTMLMRYWAEALHRSDLNCDVPEVEREVFDSKWQGAGNWAFNMAFAGSKAGIRAYVSRFSDVAELEDWIARGIPVGLSVCYNRLRGKEGPASGHLVVCVGFTPEGDVILNDPGTRLNVRKTFPRKNLIDAWANSHNAVYLIYPSTAQLPNNRFCHWED